MSERPAAGRVPCPKCEGLNPEIAKFCNRCGTELSGSAPGKDAAPKPGQRKICPGCHRFNAATAAYCTDCGVALPSAASVPLFGGPAGFWHRAAAWVIDGAIVLVVCRFVISRLALRPPRTEHLPVPEALLQFAPIFGLMGAIVVLYGMIMVGTWGGSVGKLLLGLRVVRHSDGNKVPYGLALGRALAGFISLAPFGLGCLWVALTPGKRAWHDYLCDTRVVRSQPQ